MVSSASIGYLFKCLKLKLTSQRPRVAVQKLTVVSQKQRGRSIELLKAYYAGERSSGLVNWE